MQIQGSAGITDALFSECSPVIYERCASLREDNAIWNGPFHKSILLVPSCTQDSYELLNPIMFSSSIDKKRRGEKKDFGASEVMMLLQGSSPNMLSPGLSLAMATGPPRRGRLDKQNEEIINMHNIRNVLLRLAALIIAWAPASQRPHNWRLCLNTLSALWWIYPLELGYFLFIHAPLQNFCLFISQQECIQKRVLCQLGTNHKLQWNSWLWASLAVTRGEVIYTYPMPCGLQKTRMKYEQGTEETSLGANETDSLDARGDCKYTMDATSQTEVVCQAGINFSWRTLRNRMKGTGRWHIASALVSWRLERERN